MNFQSEDTRKVLEYVKKEYGTEPEFLWARTPDNAVLRHRDTLKWFAVILTVQKQKLGIAEEGYVEILDLKCNPDMISCLIDHQRFFPGYHMNKEHWITLLLNGTIPFEEICGLLDISYDITKKK